MFKDHLDRRLAEELGQRIRAVDLDLELKMSVFQERTGMADEQITVGNLREAVQQFIAARNWEVYHTPKNLAMSIAVEAAEIMEHFQWGTVEEGKELVKDPKKKAEVADELADVMIYCLSFANSADVDVSEAIVKKLARNERRFPIAEGR